VRFNFVQPLFENLKIRQAVLHLVNQTDYLKANVANPAYFKTCSSYFGCGVSMETDANTA
jgi:peptide/nickel transport system substrate-binding protein